MNRRIEDRSQEEVLLLLRALIDTARKSPNDPGARNNALDFASRYPRALGSSKLRLRLGKERWAWLNEYGIYPTSYGVTEPEYTP